MLRRSSPMRRTALRRSGLLRRVASKVKRPRDTGPTPETRLLVWNRCGGWCERCEVAAAVHVHHRRPRRSGGSRAPETNEAANLLGLCRACHEWVESHRAVALSQGLLLHACETPATTGVLLRYGHVLLNDNGGFRRVEGDCAP